MRALLRRHPLPIRAHFEFTFVMTFAYPPAMLAPLLPPGLRLDEHQGHGFVAVAMVQTRRLRPAGLPAFVGRDFFLTGYRVFARLTTGEGRELRGLRILRSDTDSRVMKLFGNLLTHYNYHRITVKHRRSRDTLALDVTSPDGAADVQVTARLDANGLPAGSVFPDERTARKFAGPLPFTFDYERETQSIICIEGRRQHWVPQIVQAEIRRLTFLRKLFPSVEPRLVSSFFIEDVPYRWERGVREPISPALERHPRSSRGAREQSPGSESAKAANAEVGAMGQPRRAPASLE